MAEGKLVGVRGERGIGDEIREALEDQILKGLVDHINEFQLTDRFLCVISEEKYCRH